MNIGETAYQASLRVEAGFTTADNDSKLTQGLIEHEMLNKNIRQIATQLIILLT